VKRRRGGAGEARKKGQHTKKGNQHQGSHPHEELQRRRAQRKQRARLTVLTAGAEQCSNHNGGGKNKSWRNFIGRNKIIAKIRGKSSLAALV